MAQSQVNASTIKIKSMAMTAPRNTSFVLNQAAVIGNNSPFKPQLTPMNLSLFMEDTEPNIKAYAHVALPALVSTKSTPVNVQNQTVHIADVEQYTRFCELAMNSETFRLAMRGQTNLILGGMHTLVNYNKVVEMKGTFSERMEKVDCEGIWTD
jgi:hypothetical protein